MRSGRFPAPSPVPDPDHAHDGKVLTLYNIYAECNNFVSVEYTDALEGEPKDSVSKTWLRKGYSSPDDAVPLRFRELKGEQNQYKVCMSLFECPRIPTFVFPKY